MTLAKLRFNSGVRSFVTRPVSTLIGSSLLLFIMFVAFTLTYRGTRWLTSIPFIEDLAEPVMQRSLEMFFLLLMMATLFSVLVASIGIIFGADDLPFLMSLSIPSGRVFGMKTFELFLNAAGLPLLFTFPVLAGAGAALGASASFYVISFTAAVGLYALPVAFGSALALLLVRVSPPGRAREIATTVSILVAVVALVVVRAVRPEALLSLNTLTQEEFQRALDTLASLEIGWLPPAWATNAAWGALDGGVPASLFVLLGVTVGSFVLTAALARRAYDGGWLRSLDTIPVSSSRASRHRRLESLIHGRYGAAGAVALNDWRFFFRDVQLWSQGIVLIALGAMYFISLASVPVPTQQYRDVLGAMNLMFIQFLMAGIALRLAFPSVSLEGKSVTWVRTLPLKPFDFIAGKFFQVLPLMVIIGFSLGAIALRTLDVSETLAFAAPIASTLGAIGLTGLAIGVGAIMPKYQFTNPNEIVMTPGAFVFMALALAYAGLNTVLLARGAQNAIDLPFVNYWFSTEGIGFVAVIVLIMLVVTVGSLWLAAKVWGSAEPDVNP